MVTARKNLQTVIIKIRNARKTEIFSYFADDIMK